MVTKLSQTSNNIWDFVIDFKTGNMHDIQLTAEDASYIYNILEACDEVVNYKTDIYKLLNNAEENVIK